MIYLLASISSSTAILVLFRFADRSAAVTRHAILVSYFASAVTGILFFDIDWSAYPRKWFWPAALEGAAFYLVFRLMGLTARTNGLAVASIATKMSVVIPVAIGLFALGESLSVFKVLGVLAGVVAVILAASDRLSLNSWVLPIAVFFCTGLIDASFKLLQVWGLEDQQYPVFIVTVFGFAFLCGLLHHLFLAQKMINKSSTFFGVLLGLANFGTVFFLLKALATPDWESSIIYPLNHFGVVVSSTIMGFILFSERPGLMARAGLCLALVSIGFLYLASVYA